MYLIHRKKIDIYANISLFLIPRSIQPRSDGHRSHQIQSVSGSDGHCSQWYGTVLSLGAKQKKNLPPAVDFDIPYVSNVKDTQDISDKHGQFLIQQNTEHGSRIWNHPNWGNTTYNITTLAAVKIKNHINRPPSFLILHEKPAHTEPAKDHGKSPQVVVTYEHFFRVYVKKKYNE